MFKNLLLIKKNIFKSKNKNKRSILLEIYWLKDRESFIVMPKIIIVENFMKL